MPPAIRIENLGKRYTVGHERRTGYRTLRESLVDLAAAPLRRLRGEPARTTEEFWALKDVSFEVQPGEVVGIIGRNGAGKSTLLKVLSRITKPTTGRVELHGRVGSLLEVGTGFHPELTGRENVYLNGSILGMHKREIDRKFDEIVAFAEIEQFLDTPVKRYSSGMYVRLAFSVAAHLQPDSLFIDEVLAVGDAQFQTKCLGTMGAVARSGRTVLFVSHNMAAIQHLCQRVVVFTKGAVRFIGPASNAIPFLLNERAATLGVPLDARTDRQGTGEVRLTALMLNRTEAGRCVQVRSGDSLVVDIAYKSAGAVRTCFFHVAIYDLFAVSLAHCSSRAAGHDGRGFQSHGLVRCTIPRLPLPPGRYSINVAVDRDGTGTLYDRVKDAADFTVVVGDFFSTGDTSSLCWSKFLIDSIWTSS